MEIGEKKYKIQTGIFVIGNYIAGPAGGQYN